MKYYSREVISREPVNIYGVMGMIKYIEAFKIEDDDTETLKSYNYRKHIKFGETSSLRLRLRLLNHPVKLLYRVRYDEFCKG